MDPELGLMIVGVALLAAVGITNLTAYIIMFREYKRIKKVRESMEKSEEDRLKELKLKYDSDSLNLKNSQDLLDFINRITGDVVTLKYKRFHDNREMDKVTKANISNFIKETVEEINKCINRSNIDLNNLLITEEMLDLYIIDSSIFKIKKLFEEDIDEL